MASSAFLLDRLQVRRPCNGIMSADRKASSAAPTAFTDFIAFPKNNSGRDVMIDSPISDAQLKGAERIKTAWWQK
jgi:aspartyl-tRNA synthetase